MGFADLRVISNSCHDTNFILRQFYWLYDFYAGGEEEKQ